MNFTDKAVEAAYEAFSGQYDRQHIADILEAAAPYLYAQALDDFEGHLRAGAENARNSGERHRHEDALIMLDAYRSPHE